MIKVKDIPELRTTQLRNGRSSHLSHDPVKIVTFLYHLYPRLKLEQHHIGFHNWKL